jgi:hypothetical protein
MSATHAAPAGQPHRPATRQLSVEIQAEAFAAFAALAKSRKITERALITKAVALLLEEYCEPVPDAVRRRLVKLGLD